MFVDIFTAFAVVVSIGLLFAVLLALFTHLYGIKEDKKTEQIKTVLPGINCGACGFRGCSDYAEALSQGKAKPNLCIPGSITTAEELGKILGIAVEKPKDVVAFVHCNGTCTAAAEKAVYEGILTCKAGSMLFGGAKACNFGCLGCGDCANVCVSHAICVEDGIARVDTRRCMGCGMCVKECPKKIISMIPQETATAVYCSSHDPGAVARKACANACIGCKKCEKACPEQAITVKNYCAVIDYSRCTGCGACAECCPTGCLKITKFPDLSEEFSFQ